ncbi:MAG: flavodoxin family protein [Methanomassiliicoccaceae archaeon]|nr:flavodoxin family protein [Methanomassiliicoccaceae archaeon]
MKVTIFNGSPMKNDAVSTLTSYASSLLTEAGAETNEFFLYHMNIKGCMDCGVTRPDDDLKRLTEEFASSDLVIFASPVYTFGLSGSLNLFIEGLHPICKFNEAFAERIKDKDMAVMIAFGDAENTSPDVSGPLKMFCEHFSMRFTGEFAARNMEKDRLIQTYRNEISDLIGKVMKRA